jgi:hypothetical protein
VGSDGNPFRWIAVALSIILGLGVTRLLSSVVAAFRSRSHAQLDWIPFAWAGCIFLWQLQYWWAINELPRITRVWTLWSFLILVGLTLLLFVSAALVLPPAELREKDNLRTAFERDGRWALASLRTYFALALLVDWLLWNASPFSIWGGALMALMILPLGFVWTRSRRLQAAITIVYIPLSIWAALGLSPSAY